MIKTYAFRLLPGSDLKKEIEVFALKTNIQAGWIGCGIGSLKEYHIRFANQNSGHKEKGYFEIITLSGTVSINGAHLHIAIGDEQGHTIGGHLLDNNIIYTTAELIILEMGDFVFTREKDGTTEWPELQIRKKQ